ncbi:ChaN family lipoprotein [Puniceibacterium sediminis]|nr:ChaN family lipoprotein [Puniceibacterium sediminis]
MKWYAPSGGESLPHNDAIARLAAADIVLLGEQHDRADIHRWQLHVAAGLLAHRPLVMGFEMFPARLDPVLAEWIAGDMDEATFLERTDWAKVWGFPPELYLPLFRFCRETGTPMVGLNVRRDLVRQVGKGGWDSVPEADREGLSPPAPSPLPYRQFIFDLVGAGPAGRGAKGPADPAFDRFVRAQEVWDCAFATRLFGATETATDTAVRPIVVGIIGQGHLQWGGGVSWQLAHLGIDNVHTAIPQQTGAQRLQPGVAELACVLPKAFS